MQNRFLNYRVSFCVIISAIIMLAPLPAQSAQSDGCVTTNCHPRMLKAKNIHRVAEPCDTCHLASQTPHPQKKSKTFTLVQAMPGLCNQCHAPFGTAKHIHAPVKNGMCTACHNPHESNEPKLLVKPAHELCLSCHADKIKQKHVHGPTATGDCIACHSPHESNNGALVLKEGSELCFICHVDMQGVFKKKYVHSALAGGCTSCHNPHGASTKKLLSADGDKLCFQCHPAIEETVTKAKVVHQPIKTAKGCASCHAPHSSDSEKLLPKTGKDLCLDCHKDVVQKDQTVLHGPLREGKCTPCHNPHGSAYDKLLVKGFNPDFYIAYTDKEYELCFTCHNRDLLRYPATSYATGFRDGERNLHFLHVNIKDKGRSCKACHLMHAGVLQKMVAEKTLFGKWSLPLRFTKSETGGSCAPGCHQKFNYDRKTPGKAAEPSKTKGEERAQTRTR